MKRKPLTSYQVLQYWLEAQLGNAKNLRPKGYGKRTPTGATEDTKARAVTLVEGLPLYRFTHQDLIKWMTEGLEDIMLLKEFLAGLEKHLAEYPFYATTAKDMEVLEASRKPVAYRLVPDLAEEMGIKPNTLRKRLDRRKTAFTFGSYTDDSQKWQIHPMDVPEIKAMVEENVEESVEEVA